MHPLLEEKLILEHHHELEQEIERLQQEKKTGGFKVFLPSLFRKNKHK